MLLLRDAVQQLIFRMPREMHSKSKSPFSISKQEEDMSFFMPGNVGVEASQNNQEDEVQACATLSLSPVQILEV